MPPPITKRRIPTLCATTGIVVICTTGNPASSISRASVAPQRVLLPHVDVNKTPTGPSIVLSSASTFWANILARSTDVALPAVVNQ